MVNKLLQQFKMMNNFFEKFDKINHKQSEHLKRVYSNQVKNWRPCLHDSCSDCLGTGVKKDGSYCIHGISCPCPKCSPYYSK